jgi:hypothetical protein
MVTEGLASEHAYDLKQAVPFICAVVLTIAQLNHIQIFNRQ